MELRKITNGNIDECHEIANSLIATGQTCLSCGLFDGLNQINEFKNNDEISAKAVLLLSDGVPTVNSHY